MRDTRHLYLLQSKLQDKIRAWLNARTDFPPLTRSIALKHLDEGLIDRGITRDLAWGVPVTRNGTPRSGFETKVFYVWFDAPIEYIAATQEWANNEPGGIGALVARPCGRRRPLRRVHGQGTMWPSTPSASPPP